MATMEDAFTMIENLTEELARKEEKIMRLEEKERKYNLKIHKEYFTSWTFLRQLRDRSVIQHPLFRRDNLCQTDWEEMTERSLEMGVRPGVSREDLLEAQRIVGLHCGIII